MTASTSRGPSACDGSSALTFEVDVLPRVASVRLVLLSEPDPGDFAELAREFPAIGVAAWSECAEADCRIYASEWPVELLDFAEWDRLWADAARQYANVVIIGGAGLCRQALEMLTRYQRYLLRRNAASESLEFERVLRCHAELHDLAKPLVKADFDHALDVWQWTLRLSPEASVALQVAALFHDVERLESEAERRVEHFAVDYQAFKDAHAKGGARRTSALLEALDVERSVASRVVELIEAHERPCSTTRDEEAAVLADADALSFFALNSPGFVDYYGRAHTLSKVAYSLGRMRPSARPLLARIKLRADVHALVNRVMARDMEPAPSPVGRRP